MGHAAAGEAGGGVRGAYAPIPPLALEGRPGPPLYAAVDGRGGGIRRRLAVETALGGPKPAALRSKAALRSARKCAGSRSAICAGSGDRGGPDDCSGSYEP